ncbi:uncharacterized protein VP01_9677g1, partial [Puccinia sorghi]
ETRAQWKIRDLDKGSTLDLNFPSGAPRTRSDLRSFNSGPCDYGQNLSPSAPLSKSHLGSQRNQDVCDRLPRHNSMIQLTEMAITLRLHIVCKVLTSGRRSSTWNLAWVGRFYNFLVTYIIVLGSFYPIIWSSPVS